ncbi:hypothetical protein COLO4_20674 [Corchorus olitorius]|uniref:Uncharacterized protein n=1 Tax=Corchorus olitorius TaxID=93759 RepID=A0A1R3IXR5_9ROSI|nr:hypothetical protein COLO4_20674 [Corchorus olitorius]
MVKVIKNAEGESIKHRKEKVPQNTIARPKTDMHAKRNSQRTAK